MRKRLRKNTEHENSAEENLILVITQGAGDACAIYEILRRELKTKGNFIPVIKKGSIWKQRFIPDEYREQGKYYVVARFAKPCKEGEIALSKQKILCIPIMYSGEMWKRQVFKEVTRLLTEEF